MAACDSPRLTRHDSGCSSQSRLSIGGEDDDLLAEEELSQKEIPGLASWEDGGGRTKMEGDVEKLRTLGYDAVWTTRSWSNEVVVGIEIPWRRLGLSSVHSDSLRLEEGSAVVVTVRASVSEHNAAGILLPTSQRSSNGLSRRLVLPNLAFSVLKARSGSLPAIVHSRTLGGSSEAAAADFSVRWSLEHLLNRFFPAVSKASTNCAVEALLPKRTQNCTGL